jgi:transcription elongation factor GreA
MQDESDGEPMGQIVQLGSRVRVLEGGQLATWRIVEAYEADALEGRISNMSPVGAALLNHRVGGQVRVELPGGRAHLTIVSVE